LTALFSRVRKHENNPTSISGKAKFSGNAKFNGNAMSRALKPTTDLANRIAQIYPSLSEGHRKAADFVLQSPLDSATVTIEGLAEKSGTSTATVTRFVRALGYRNYGDFRAALSFLKARRIFIVGSGASYYVGAFLEDGLALYLDADVVFASSRGGPERAVRHMLSAGPDDVVIAISLPRYSRNTLELAKFASKRGAVLIALTDGPSSPLVQLADMTFFAPARNSFLPNSPTAAFAIAGALITTLARERPDAVEALKGLSESLLWTFHY
jgi:DNA-binding MurR/RpiR family transcriptional regulator